MMTKNISLKKQLATLILTILSFTGYSMKAKAEEPQQVYILLYHLKTNNEGIHVIQTPEKTTVLMFESKQNAERYSFELERINFPKPTLELIDIQQIKSFCSMERYECRLVRKKEYISPPVNNVNPTDVRVNQDKPKL